jgi:N-acetyl-anhydromuramyl-L-alanine amidase AmpD
MLYKVRIILIFCFIAISSVFANKDLKIVDKRVHFGIINVPDRTIDAIIIHSVFNKSGGDKYSLKRILKQFHRYHVSSHYIIGRNGKIYRLVDEKMIALQAGKSCLPDGRTEVNACSIGIELITSNDRLDSPTKDQITSLVELVKDIKSRYTIKYVLRHSDIAPGRKTDPWNMNWEDFLKRI